MKTILTLTLIICSLACFGQEQKKVLSFSAFEKGEMADFEAGKTQLIKIFRAQDSLQSAFLKKFLVRNGVDLTRLSQHKDSLTIKAEGIEYILKPIKK